MHSFTVYRGTSDGAIRGDLTTAKELAGDQVLVKTTASDIHFGKANIALGHEGVGIVQAVDPAVSHLKIGDRVGWGYIHDSCGHCEYCLNGSEVYCNEAKQYGLHDHDQGSFSSGAIWREAFLFPIPDALTDVEAAPLQCGGATVYNALEPEIRPSDVVGVIGVGGLGHLAIQFASKMGSEVIVLSGSDDKRDVAFAMGAKHFIVTKGKTELHVGRPINRLLVTTSTLPDWDQIFPILAARAVIYPLTISFDRLSLPAFGLIAKGLRVQGLAVAPRGVHQRMLKFAALHGIKPTVERFPMTEDGIQEALERLNDGKMRFRGVLIPQ